MRSCRHLEAEPLWQGASRSLGNDLARQNLIKRLLPAQKTSHFQEALISSEIKSYLENQYTIIGL